MYKRQAEEPFVDAHIYTPTEYTGSLMELCQNRRGVMRDMKYLDATRVDLHYELPLGEIVYDFFDAIKSRSRGSVSYTHLDVYKRQPLSLACTLIACYLLARSPMRWLAALRVSIAAVVLFWVQTVAELVILALCNAALTDLLATLGFSLLSPAFWLSAIAMTLSLARKKRAEKEL